MLWLRVKPREAERGSLPLMFGFEYVENAGAQCFFHSDIHGLGLNDESKRLVWAYTTKIETKRRLLGVQGQTLIMSVTTEHEIWKYGTLTY